MPADLNKLIEQYLVEKNCWKFGKRIRNLNEISSKLSNRVYDYSTEAE
jgi:hypothetical protein